MILVRLTVNDFGVFGGPHDFDLSPKNRKPIVLFGGKNGAGKSTLLEALRLCLYGSGALGAAIARDDYLQFLGTRIHGNPNALIQPTFASLQVEFQYSHADGLATYVVTRSWERRSSNKVSELLTIERNGRALEDIEAEHWQDFIRELIPPGVSQLFFFDGEKIQQLAEDTTDQLALSDAVKSLLGVDIVERLQADLHNHLARLNKPEARNSCLRQIRDLEKSIGHIQRKLLKLRERRTGIETTLQQLRAEIERTEGSLAASGGAFARNRDHLLHQEATLKERIKQLEDLVRQHCAGLLPFTLVPALCDRLKQQLLREEEATRIEAGQTLVKAAKREILKRLEPDILWSGQEGVSDETKQYLHSRIRRALGSPLNVEQLEKVPLVHQLSDSTARNLLAWIEQAASDVAPALKATDEELERTYRELHKVAESLGKIPTDEVIKPILESLRGLNERLVRVSAEGLLKDQSIKDAEAEVKDAERRHGQLAQKLAGDAKYSGKLRLLPRVQAALDEYRSRLIEKKIAQLEEAVTHSFNLLCRKKDSLRTIRIDPKNFSITLCDRQGRPLPKSQLSAGEKQIYAISMLWALGKTSGRPLPVVIDTPLARLDSDHRRLLVENYFPFASHQVMLLSTDTEVDQVYFDALKPAVARAYHLDYDQREFTTTIKQGYFWKERDEAFKVAAH